MRIGVVSDTHDRIEAVSESIRILTSMHRVELIIHCGDIESPETALLFKDCPTHFVYGNWDKDRIKLATAIKSIGGTPHDGFGALELSGKRVAWCHSHERHQLYQLEHSNYFDYLFYGHTHVREQHRTGKTLVANPGALFRANPKTCIVLDLATGELKPVIVSPLSKSGDAESSAVGTLVGEDSSPDLRPVVKNTVGS